MGYTLPPPPSSAFAPPTDPDPDPLTNAHTLIARKSSIEAALASQLDILREHNTDMATPLVDPAGFPRADIDIVAVRSARVRVLELRNDLNVVLEDVKKALEAVHAANATTAAKQKAEQSTTGEKVDEAQLTPFARIDGVAPGSPAASAGLQREDILLAFGSLTSGSLTSSSLSPSGSSATPTNLAPLAALASSHEDRPLQLRVLRASQPLTLTLIPRKWGGRGLIGCHIVPYTTPP